MPWTDLLMPELNVNKMLTKFYDSFQGVWNKHTPIKSRRIRAARIPWITEDVLSLAYIRDDIYKKFLRNRNDKTCREYKILRNAIINTKPNAKCDFFSVERGQALNTSGGISKNVQDSVKSSRF